MQSEDNADVTLAQLADEEVFEVDTSSLFEEEDNANSEADDSDDNDAASAGSDPEYSPDSLLVQHAQYVEEVVPVGSTPSEQPQSSTAHPTFASSTAAQPADDVFANIPTPVKTLSYLAWPGINNHVTFPSDVFDSTIAPVLPPRPSQKRQRIWDEPSHEDSERMLGTSSNVPSWTPMEGLGHEYREYQEASFEPAFGFQRVADRIHTPPPTVPAAEALDAIAATGKAVVRKTGLSIPEIVDEQPPTPTSIKSHKRSADEAFDEDTRKVNEQGAAEPEVKVAAPEVALPIAEQVAPRLQRPIAQPKSILRRALSAAKVMVPATALGAMFTVGALTALPESFFTVA